MSDLYARIYELVRLIPKGRVSSYGAIARYIGSPKGARMVGWAMNQSHTSEAYTPAHRVVNRMGMLTGKHHFPGEHLMQELLENEGLVIVEDQIQDFDRVFWDPFKELDENSI